MSEKIFAHLWTTEDAYVDCTPKEYKDWFLKTGTPIFVKGCARELQYRKVAPGVIRVSKVPLGPSKQEQEIAQLRSELTAAQARVKELEARAKDCCGRDNENQNHAPGCYAEGERKWRDLYNGLLGERDLLQAERDALAASEAEMREALDLAKTLKKYSQTPTDEANWAQWYRDREKIDSGCASHLVELAKWQKDVTDAARATDEDSEAHNLGCSILDDQLPVRARKCDCRLGKALFRKPQPPQEGCQ